MQCVAFRLEILLKVVRLVIWAKILQISCVKSRLLEERCHQTFCHCGWKDRSATSTIRMAISVLQSLSSGVGKMSRGEIWSSADLMSFSTSVGDTGVKNGTVPTWRLGASVLGYLVTVPNEELAKCDGERDGVEIFVPRCAWAGIKNFHHSSVLMF